MGKGVFDAGGNGGDLKRLACGAGMRSEVCAEGSEDTVAVALHHRDDALQALTPSGQVWLPVGSKGTALGFKRRLQPADDFRFVLCGRSRLCGLLRFQQ